MLSRSVNRAYALPRAALAVLAVVGMARAYVEGYDCPSACEPPDCFCPELAPPGGLDPTNTPQLCLFTFDDAVNQVAYDQVQGILTNHWNPNGDPVQVTFFIKTDYSDYWLIRKLAAEGNEIAMHTMTHTTDTNTLLETWRAEVVGCRKTLSDLAGLPMDEIVGFRAPYLEYNDNSLRLLHEQNILYDSSVVEGPWGLSEGPTLMVWPYTLDYGVPGAPPPDVLPRKEFEGVFEMPLYSFFNTNGIPIGTSPPTNSYEDALLALQYNFTQRYMGNRAPMHVLFHAARWATLPSQRQAVDDFMTWVAAYFPDAWFVSMSDGVAFMRDPQDIQSALTFPPFAKPDVSVCAESNVNTCAYSGEGSFRTCAPCPLAYPAPDRVYTKPKIVAGGSVVFRITAVWSSSVEGKIAVTNTSTEATAAFDLGFTTTNGTISGLWGATWTGQGATVSVHRADWLAPGEGVELDFNATGTSALDFLDVNLVFRALEPMRPKLDIAISNGTEAVLEWDDSAYGYELQRRTNLLSGTWDPQVEIHGRTDWATNLPPDAPAVFYRLNVIP